LRVFNDRAFHEFFDRLSEEFLVDNEWIHIVVILEVLVSDGFGCVIFATK
jgi:hypothetical protein